MRSGPDKQANLAAAERLVAEAAGLGATVVALPEMFNVLGSHEEMVRNAEVIPGETSIRMQTLARRHGRAPDGRERDAADAGRPRLVDRGGRSKGRRRAGGRGRDRQRERHLTDGRGAGRARV